MPVKGSQQRLSSSVLCLAASSTLAISAPAKASETVAPKTDISFGTPAGECALPAIVQLTRGNKCTGTLIHPRVVLFAAHCKEPRTVAFGERGQGPKITQISKISIHPKFKQGNSSGPTGAAIDWAVAVLAQPMTGVPIIPLAYAGELEAYQKAGQAINLAGYGSTKTSHYGSLIWTDAKIEQVSNGSMTTIKDKRNACPGDSGGPVLARLQDGSWRTIGIMTNLGPALDSCGKDSGYNRMSQVRPEMLKWLEQETGIDLTLCYNDAGQVDRGPECKNFFAGDLKAPSGKWSNNCADAKVVAKPKLTPTGGGDDPGEDEKEDKSAPELKLELVDVKDTEKLAVGDKVEIEVEIEDDSEIKSASLHINDKEVKAWKKAPYTYTWEVEKAGSFEIQAKATDEAGNEGESKALKIKVEGDDPGEGTPKETEDPSTEPSPGNSEDPSKTPSEDPTPKTPDTPEPSEPSEPKEPSNSDPTVDKPAVQEPKEGPVKSGGCDLAGDGFAGWALGLVGLLGLMRRRR